eukprot:TRINITY_DN24726_c0_g1_i1.p1 TRINITY_DN24726_c0_g1~~TRINITY_DN24726_c0_g1_i1.p1  ORF type:complete len:377 (+),score=83.11 TRINITY_DN24726_c0_g1_i1:87-1133(+)
MILGGRESKRLQSAPATAPGPSEFPAPLLIAPRPPGGRPPGAAAQRRRNPRKVGAGFPDECGSFAPPADCVVPFPAVRQALAQGATVTLGRGGTAVRRCESWNGGCAAAIKQGTVTAVLREAGALSAARHDCVVRLLGSSIGPDASGFLLTQYCGGGDLERALRAAPTSDLTAALRDAAVGLTHMHNLGIAHNAVYPCHIFLRNGQRACLGGMSRASRIPLPDGGVPAPAAVSDVGALGGCAVQCLTRDPADWRVSAARCDYNVLASAVEQGWSRGCASALLAVARDAAAGRLRAPEAARRLASPEGTAVDARLREASLCRARLAAQAAERAAARPQAQRGAEPAPTA